jgi:hypothetical protein
MQNSTLSQILLNLRQSASKAPTALDQSANPNSLGSLALAWINQHQQNAKSKEQKVAEYNAQIADLISGKISQLIPEKKENIEPIKTTEPKEIKPLTLGAMSLTAGIPLYGPGTGKNLGSLGSENLLKSGLGQLSLGSKSLLGQFSLAGNETGLGSLGPDKPSNTGPEQTPLT